MSNSDIVKYAKTSCADCHVILEKRHMHRVQVTDDSGFSHSSSIKPFSKHPLRTVSVGVRRYYKNRDIWLCSDCFSIFRRKQTARRIRIFLFLAAICAVVYLNIPTDLTNESLQPSADSSSADSAPTNHLEETTPALSDQTLQESGTDLNSEPHKTSNLKQSENSSQSSADEVQEIDEGSTITTPSQEDSALQSTDPLPEEERLDSSVKPCEFMKLC